MIYTKIFYFLLATLLCSCQSVETEKSTESTVHIRPEVLKETDRAFSNLSFEKGMNYAFETYIADDGVVLRNNSFPIVGKDSVISRHFSRPDSSFRLTWEPMYADISQSGDLGYTYGTYLVSSRKGDSLSVGTYISIWKKQADDSWKFVFDAGNDGL